ncbi:glycosyltransferase family 2 protein [Chitinophaga oryzae]|uniref:Glycosyltransferase family 2 protein n=1 Tax=Chitinophaga oryzae TaxID=2725414 RepID=A0AAE6ZHS6_9BACT|nr:glycosyltransferase family 2 protein [Chitinophaga oryzae]QJB33235.1 glycosyltransferase family 2 protein [Chitinophaga oryzae]QJB39711.1 glycosyltransferase family 2 protein [Chitinophaga oryzae]
MHILPSVAVVILNWNGKAFLEKFLPSVCRSTYGNLQLVLADNASTDDSVAFVTANYPSVRIVRNPSNDGFAGGYNEALAHVEADIYVLLNQDVEVEPGWIEPVVALMESDPRIAACQPKMRAYHQPDEFEYAGAAGGWMDVLGYTFCRGRILYTTEKDEGQYDDVQDVFWATGAALFIRSACFRQVGGFDRDFFAHMEEVDLCWRLQRAGYRVCYCPDSKVFHVGGGSLPQGNPRKLYLNFRNNLMMLWKNLHSEDRWIVLFQRFFLDILAAVKSLVSGKPKDMAAIWRAYRDYYRWRKTYVNKHELPEVKLMKMKGVFHGIMIWRYYFLRRKKFKDLI